MNSFTLFGHYYPGADTNLFHLHSQYESKVYQHSHINKTKSIQFEDKVGITYHRRTCRRRLISVSLHGEEFQSAYWMIHEIETVVGCGRHMA